MKRRSILLAVALCAVAALGDRGEVQAQSLTLYVAPNGSDVATGAKNKPLATLAGARDAIRRLRAQGKLPKRGVHVEVAGGTYAFSEPLLLTAQDSGSPDAPIDYRAARGQQVRLTGGCTVTGFTPVTDPAVRERLDPSVRVSVLQADLKAQGITDYGAMTPRGFGRALQTAGIEVFCDDKPLPLARWPNNGFVRVTDVPDAKNRQIASTEIAARAGRWTSEPDLWAFGYWFHDWADAYDKVAAVDTINATLTFAAPGSNYSYRKGQRFFILNALSELDRPGEWYVDRDKGMLYLIPPGPLKPGSVTVSVARSLIDLDGVSNVSLRGFTLEACRGDAVHIRGGMSSGLVACTLRNIGNRAVVVDGGATRSGVVGCDIYETGDGGIVLSGGDRKTLTPAALFAENNQIHDYSRWSRTYRPGVSVNGVGNRVSHNLIYDGPHNAIQLSGNDHLIEFNEIHNVCYETGDVGAFYMGRDWTARGTVIRHNYFHHISGPGHIGAMGVYLDDQASGITITGNRFEKVTRAVFIGGGDDNTVTNNLFIDCVPSVHLDARGLGWQKAATENPKDTLQSNYNAVPVSDTLWRTRYPTLIARFTEGEKGAPVGNVVARNISVGGRWSDVEAKAKPGITFTDNVTDTDPGFVNAAKGDYRLKKNAPALRAGFVPLPLEQMGLYKDPDRATWPVSHPVKAVEVPVSPATTKPSTLPPAPVVAVPRGTAPTIDGTLAPSEWDGAAVQVLEQGIGREVVSPPSRVFVRVSGNDLYIAFENTVEVAVPLRLGSAWGQDDAIEVALKAGGTPNAPTYVLRGFAGGKFVSSTEANASPDDASRLGSAVTYASKVISPTLWTAELKIPLAALNLPNTSGKLSANFTVRKSAGPTWVLWRGTNGNSWLVDQAGILNLTP